MRRIGGPLAVALVTALSGLALMWQPGAQVDARDLLPPVPRTGVGQFNVVASANCTQWRNASDAQKRAVVDALGRHFGHRSAIFEGARMPDGVAFTTLERACARPEARAIRLYKIYGRALAFRGFR